MRQWCHHGRVIVETISTARRWSMLFIALSATLVLQRLHQRRRLPDPHPALDDGARPGPRRLGLVDAELWDGADADRLGIRRGPGRGTLRAHRRVGADRGRGLRCCRSALAGPGECLPALGRHGCGQQQFGERAAGRRLVPTATARLGDGNPPDCPTAGRGPWRLGDSATGPDASPTADRVCCGGSTPSRSCWWCRSAWCGRSRWCG